MPDGWEVEFGQDPLFDELSVEAEAQEPGVPPHATVEIGHRDLDLAYVQDCRDRGLGFDWS